MSELRITVISIYVQRMFSIFYFFLVSEMLVSLILIVLLFPICAVLLWKLHISLENYSERNSYHTPTM
jgi:hypothetical protein